MKEFLSFFYFKAPYGTWTKHFPEYFRSLFFFSLFDLVIAETGLYKQMTVVHT